MTNIPSRITTGFNNEINNLEREELEINITSSVMTFMSFAMKTAAIYAEHCNRTVITTDDIKQAMMIEVFMYFNRPDLEIQISQWRQTILNDFQEQEDETDEESSNHEIENENEIIENEKKNSIDTCNCEICNTMKTISDKWKNYNPSDDLGKIFKKHIDNI